MGSNEDRVLERVERLLREMGYDDVLIREYVGALADSGEYRTHAGITPAALREAVALHLSLG